eukprot:gnl/Chilomastix_cuspidata/1885.p3 GENE.gnl/Chilomastix_cuspidata/1885~~gnl/Chilomastix_cuspidata/1885.p3  ORF type:complete len:374 (-),score=210.59 gnl/Chilomastix_cuspidata/1885:63-1184(-)
MRTCALRAMGVQERIREIEAEMARTQKNKATEHHLGLLKAKLAKLQRDLIEEASASAGKGEGFDVAKSGVARVVLIGFPSVGKSSLLQKLTKARSEAAEYQFTTLTCIPGLMEINGARVQILDLPGIVEGAASGVGRGRQVIAVARTANLVLVMLDAAQADTQKRLLEAEMARMGIRLNSRPARVSVTPKKTGGIIFNATVPLTHLSPALVQKLLKEYRMFNADVLVHEDATVDQFIDAIEGNRQYIPALYLYNKVDTVSLTAVDHYARQPDAVVLSTRHALGLDFLTRRMWEKMSLVRVYTKTHRSAPDLSDPIFFRSDVTVREACGQIHGDMLRKFRHALVWGRSALHDGQRVGLDHVLMDEDVLQVVTNK